MLTTQEACKQYVRELQIACPNKDCHKPVGELCDTNGVWIHLERFQLAEQNQAPTVIVVKMHDPDSWSGGGGKFVAVALDEDAAMRWIQDEVDGKHPNAHSIYMQGKDALWWISYGRFSLTTVVLQQ